MYLSFDISKLRNHLIYLRQELDLAYRLQEELEQEKQLQLEIGGEVSPLCLRHIHFALGLRGRIRDRMELLENVMEHLANAEGKMTEAVIAGMEILNLGTDSGQ